MRGRRISIWRIDADETDSSSHRDEPDESWRNLPPLTSLASLRCLPNRCSLTKPLVMVGTFSTPIPPNRWELFQRRLPIRLVMPGFGELTTSAKHESQWAAVAQASNQARRMVLARLTRRQARRVRRHQKFFESFRSHFDQMVDV